MRGRALAGLPLALSIVLGSALARGETRRLAEVLTVERAQCLAPATLASAVAAWRKDDRVDVRLRIEVVESAARGARFVLRRDDEVVGERTLDAAGASCDELREALALTLAVSIDAIPPAPPSPPPAAPPAPAAPSVAPPSAPPPAPALRTLHLPSTFGGARASQPSGPFFAFEVDVEGGVAIDLVPTPVGVLSATVGLRLGRSAPLGGVVRAGLLVTSAGSFTVGAGTAEARLAAGRLDGCVHFQPGRFGLDGCVGAAVGRLAARGSGFDRDADAAAPWAAITGRLAGRVSIVPAFALTAGVEGLVPIVAPRLEVEDSDHQTVVSVPVPPVALGLTAGVVVTFP
ncbi:MAG: hypothetical protein QM820_60985 [Minicystis sp.]